MNLMCKRNIGLANDLNHQEIILYFYVISRSPTLIYLQNILQKIDDIY